MAAAMLSHVLAYRYVVASAGIRRGHSDPYAVAVMDEIGIDISDHEPCLLKELGDTTFDLIITLSPEAHHHALELTRTMDVVVEFWPTSDATIALHSGNRERVLESYRKVRDTLFERIRTRFDVQGGPSV